MEGAEVLWERRSAMVVQVADEARRAAACLLEGDVPLVSPERVSGRLVNEVLLHVEADIQLAKDLCGARIARVREQRMELGHLIEQLDRLLVALARGQGNAKPRRVVAETLTRIATLLDQHHAFDDELRTAALRSVPPDDSFRLSDKASAAEREGTQALRFLWHPPVPTTEAIALRRNPRARRVLILDAAGAAAVDLPQRMRSCAGRTP